MVESIHDTLNNINKKMPNWWGYDKARVHHTEAFENTANKIEELKTIINKMLSKKNEKFGDAIDEHKEALKYFYEARKCYINAGEGGIRDSRYKQKMVKGHDYFNRAAKMVKESKIKLQNNMPPTSASVHRKLSKLHENAYNRSSLDPKRMAHHRMKREHSTLVGIYETEPTITPNVKMYSERIIKESLNTFGMKDIRDLKIQSLEI